VAAEPAPAAHCLGPPLNLWTVGPAELHHQSRIDGIDPARSISTKGWVAPRPVALDAAKRPNQPLAALRCWPPAQGLLPGRSDRRARPLSNQQQAAPRSSSRGQQCVLEAAPDRCAAHRLAAEPAIRCAAGRRAPPRRPRIFKIPGRRPTAPADASQQRRPFTAGQQSDRFDHSAAGVCPEAQHLLQRPDPVAVESPSEQTNRTDQPRAPPWAASVVRARAATSSMPGGVDQGEARTPGRSADSPRRLLPAGGCSMARSVKQALLARAGAIEQTRLNPHPDPARKRPTWRRRAARRSKLAIEARQLGPG